MTKTVTILVLAAGLSTRMRGSDKLLRDIDGQPLLARTATRAAKVAPTRVVLGPGQTERRACLDAIDGIDIVEAREGSGMSGSIRAGIDGERRDGVLIVLADMPDVTAEDMATLIALWGLGMAPILRAAGQDGTPGHPVLFPKARFADLAGLSGDGGAAPVLKAHAKDVALLPLTADRAVTDLDTPEDWARWEADRTEGKGRAHPPG